MSRRRGTRLQNCASSHWKTKIRDCILSCRIPSTIVRSNIGNTLLDTTVLLHLFVSAEYKSRKSKKRGAFVRGSCMNEKKFVGFLRYLTITIETYLHSERVVKKRYLLDENTSSLDAFLIGRIEVIKNLCGIVYDSSRMISSHPHSEGVAMVLRSTRCLILVKSKMQILSPADTLMSYQDG